MRAPFLQLGPEFSSAALCSVTLSLSRLFSEPRCAHLLSYLTDCSLTLVVIDVR
jgi:hypothetical protein